MDEMSLVAVEKVVDMVAVGMIKIEKKIMLSRRGISTFSHYYCSRKNIKCHSIVFLQLLFSQVRDSKMSVWQDHDYVILFEILT